MRSERRAPASQGHVPAVAGLGRGRSVQLASSGASWGPGRSGEVRGQGHAPGLRAQRLHLKQDTRAQEAWQVLMGHAVPGGRGALGPWWPDCSLAAIVMSE